MSTNPIRVATAVISNRIFAGRLNKAGDAFKGERFDVTSDVMKAVIDKIGVGFEANVEVGGEPKYVIRVTEYEPPTPDAA